MLKIPFVIIRKSTLNTLKADRYYMNLYREKYFELLEKTQYGRLNENSVDVKRLKNK